MNRYSKEALQSMAKDAILAKEQGDPRYHHLLMTMFMFTGLQPQEVERKINELAEKGETE